MNLKILIIDTGFLYGSGRVPIFSKIKTWKKLGLDLTVLTTIQGAKHYRQFIPGLHFITIGSGPNPHNRFFLIFELLRRLLVTFSKTGTILKNDFQVIYSISSVTDLLVFPFFLKLLRPSLVWTAVFDNTVSLSGSGPLLIRLLALCFYKVSLHLLRHADYIFVITPQLRSHLSGLGFSASRLVVTGNGIEADLIKKARYRKPLATSAIYMGRINETKGIYDFIPLVQGIRQHYQDFVLGLMGTADQSALSAFRRQINKHHLSRNFKFIGFQSSQKKYDYLKSSQAFIFLSPKESFGVALLEALGVGLPAVVYDLPAYKHLGKHPHLNRVPLKDVGAATLKLLDLLHSTNVPTPDIHLLNHYSWDKLARIELQAFTKPNKAI